MLPRNGSTVLYALDLDVKVLNSLLKRFQPCFELGKSVLNLVDVVTHFVDNTVDLLELEVGTGFDVLNLVVNIFDHFLEKL